MKSRPILFSGPMVRAILDGRKTQTRRVVKSSGGKNAVAIRRESRFVDIKTDLGYPASLGNSWAGFLLGPDSESPGYFKCPYGVPGDQLWVRETWREALSETHQCAAYRVSDEYQCGKKVPDGANEIAKWKPSIFMPRWASRITLEIVNVRVERLQDITEDDAMAEGVEWLFTQKQIDNHGPSKGTKPEDHGYKNYLWHGLHGTGPTWKQIDAWSHQYSNYTEARGSFSSLWQSINGDTYPWESNPWVWVVEFKRID